MKTNRLHFLRAALSVSAVLLLSGCSTVPITGRSQLNIVSDDEVLSASLTEYRSYMSTAKRSSDRDGAAMVKRVGRRIADATERYLRDNGLEEEVKNFDWEFNLVQDEEINAFCMPGGKIVVYEGLMKLVSSDDELAVVLGHEVAHAVAKHGNERMSQQMVAAAGVGLLGLALSDKSELTQTAAVAAFGLGAEVGVLLPFSRSHESEADHMGLVLMTLAGYDPGVAPGFWRKMAAQGGDKPLELLSTHPSDETRIADLERLLPEVRSQYGAR